MNSRVEAVLARLGGLHPKRIDTIDSSTLSLDRIERLLAALGNPQDKLPPVIHVAGTNGKGSTVATLRACLEAAGYRVHVYTSPHLVRFNERIRVAGELIGDDALAAGLEECERANAGGAITFFEIVTAVAFLAHGGAGCISVTANVAPRICAQLQDAWHLGSYDDVFRLRDVLVPLNDAMFVETNPAPVKFGASLLGKCTAETRLPLAPLSVKSQARIEEAMRATGLLPE